MSIARRRHRKVGQEFELFRQLVVGHAPFQQGPGPTRAELARLLPELGPAQKGPRRSASGGQPRHKDVLATMLHTHVMQQPGIAVHFACRCCGAVKGVPRSAQATPCRCTRCK